MIPYLDANFCAKVVFPDRESPTNDIFKGMYKGKLIF